MSEDNSLTRKGLRAIASVFSEAIVPKERMDSFENARTGIGTLKDKSRYNQFVFRGFLDPAEIEQMCTVALFRIITDSLAEDATQEGFDLVVEEDDDKDISSEILDVFDKLGCDWKLTNAAIDGRRYGWGGLWLLTERQTDYTQPLKLGEKLTGVIQLERRDIELIESWVIDPKDPQYGEPEFYKVLNRIAGSRAQASVKIHHSRIIPFHGPRLSKELRTINGGFHMSALQAPFDIISQHEMSWGAVANVLQDAAQSVYKMQGLFAAGRTGDRELIAARMALIDQQRSVTRAIVLDADKESFERQQYSFTGYSAIIDKLATRLSMSADMPMTRLFGVSPAGMNATGESDMKIWETKVGAYSKRTIVPGWRRLVEVIGAGIKGWNEKLNWKVTAKPLRAMDPLQQATIRKMVADTDAVYINTQVVTPEEVATSRFTARGWSAEMNIDLQLREEIKELDSERALEDAKNPPAEPTTGEVVTEETEETPEDESKPEA